MGHRGSNVLLVMVALQQTCCFALCRAFFIFFNVMLYPCFMGQNHLQGAAKTLCRHRIHMARGGGGCRRIVQTLKINADLCTQYMLHSVSFCKICLLQNPICFYIRNWGLTAPLIAHSFSYFVEHFLHFKYFYFLIDRETAIQSCATKIGYTIQP